jgi:hypothetical protein
MTSETQWTVTIEEKGRSGLIRYQEGESSALFYWEFGGGSAVVLISPRDPGQWDQIHPWASGRKAEIMENVARDVCRQKAPACSFKIDADYSCITILEPSKSDAP